MFPVIVVVCCWASQCSTLDCESLDESRNQSFLLLLEKIHKKIKCRIQTISLFSTSNVIIRRSVWSRVTFSKPFKTFIRTMKHERTVYLQSAVLTLCSWLKGFIFNLLPSWTLESGCVFTQFASRRFLTVNF